jgi:hypothetical protein
MVWRVVARYGMALHGRRGVEIPGWDWSVMAVHGMARQARRVMVGLGKDVYGWFGRCEAWQAWRGLARRGR